MVVEQSSASDDLILRSIQEIAAQNLDPNNVPHIASALESLMKAFGGVEGFSRHVALNYLASRPGSSARHKTLQSLMNLMIKVSESGAARVPLELLSEEDLEREIDRRAKRLRIGDEQSAGEDVPEEYSGD